MTGREKIEAAFSGEGTPEIPAVICYEGIYVRDHWSQLTSRPWWHAQAPDLERQAAWRRDAIARTRQDWFDLPACLPRADREALSIETRPEGIFRIDRRTGREARLNEPRVGGWDPSRGCQSVRPDRLPASRDEIDAAIPTPRAVDPARLRADGAADLAALLLAEHGPTLFPLRSVASPLGRCYGLWGFEGMMTQIATRPDLVEHACRRLLASSIAAAEEAAALGAAGIWIEECLTDLIHPEAFRRLSVPCVRELVEAVRAAGMKSIYYFCGDPTGKWDSLLSAGADALSLEESKKGFTIDIDDVVARVAGRCTVLGNLDAVGVLQNGTDQQLRAEVARQLAAGRRNASRFLMSLGSPVTPATPVARVRRYCELVRELGGE